VGFRAALDAVEKRRSVALAKSIPQLSSLKPVTTLTELSQLTHTEEVLV
jgi:hypothetical protein